MLLSVVNGRTYFQDPNKRLAKGKTLNSVMVTWEVWQSWVWVGAYRVFHGIVIAIAAGDVVQEQHIALVTRVGSTASIRLVCRLESLGLTLLDRDDPQVADAIRQPILGNVLPVLLFDSES